MLKSAPSVVQSGQRGYFGVYSETSLKMGFGCNAPRAVKTAFDTMGTQLHPFLRAGFRLSEQNLSRKAPNEDYGSL